MLSYYITDPTWWAIPLGINIVFIFVMYALQREFSIIKDKTDAVLYVLGSLIVSLTIWFIAVLANVS